MAIAYDSASSNTNTNSQTWSHTCTGSDLVLVVHCIYIQGISNITGITYNGTAMTQAQNVVDGFNFATYYLANPSTGANTISVSLGSTGQQFFGGAVSVTGADQANPVDVIPTYLANALTPMNWTTNYTNSFLFDAFLYNNTAITPAPNAGQTQRFFTANTRTFGGSTKPTTTAGSYTTGWTNYGGAFARVWGVAIKEASVVTGTSKFFQLF